MGERWKHKENVEGIVAPYRAEVGSAVKENYGSNAEIKYELKDKQS